MPAPIDTTRLARTLLASGDRDVIDRGRARQPDMSPLFAAATSDRPSQPPMNTIPQGSSDPFDRYNDPWGEVPMIINNPFADPPSPELPRMWRPLPFRLGPPTG
jgi:hypothetical protein